MIRDENYDSILVVIEESKDISNLSIQKLMALWTTMTSWKRGLLQAQCEAKKLDKRLLGGDQSKEVSFENVEFHKKRKNYRKRIILREHDVELTKIGISKENQLHCNELVNKPITMKKMCKDNNRPRILIPTPNN